jgi:hypothetical protein
MIIDRQLAWDIYVHILDAHSLQSTSADLHQVHPLLKLGVGQKQASAVVKRDDDV